MPIDTPNNVDKKMSTRWEGGCLGKTGDEKLDGLNYTATVFRWNLRLTTYSYVSAIGLFVSTDGLRKNAPTGYQRWIMFVLYIKLLQRTKQRDV